jgi:hypothetical protein
MTRRERHIRIIESWGDSPTYRHCASKFTGYALLDHLKDESVELLARDLLAAKAFHKRLAARNRAHFAKAGAA